MDSLVDGRIRLFEIAAVVLHRLVDHAAEDQSRRARADPRQDGPRRRQLDAAAGSVKGLPLAYNRDLQEDKEPLFDSFDTVRSCLELAAPLVKQANLNRARSPSPERRPSRRHDPHGMAHQEGRPAANRPPRRGRLVRQAMDRGVSLAALSLEEMQKAHPSLDASVFDSLGPTGPWKRLSAMVPRHLVKSIANLKSAREIRPMTIQRLFGDGTVLRFAIAVCVMLFGHGRAQDAPTSSARNSRKNRKSENFVRQAIGPPRPCSPRSRRPPTSCSRRSTS